MKTTIISAKGKPATSHRSPDMVATSSPLLQKIRRAVRIAASAARLRTTSYQARFREVRTRSQARGTVFGIRLCRLCRKRRARLSDPLKGESPRPLSVCRNVVLSARIGVESAAFAVLSTRHPALFFASPPLDAVSCQAARRCAILLACRRPTRHFCPIPHDRRRPFLSSRRRATA